MSEIPTAEKIKVGDIINGKTILWMDNPSLLISDMLIKIGIFDGITENKKKCSECGTVHTTTNNKYKNINFIRISEL